MLYINQSVSDKSSSKSSNMYHYKQENYRQTQTHMDMYTYPSFPLCFTLITWIALMSWLCQDLTMFDKVSRYSNQVLLNHTGLSVKRVHIWHRSRLITMHAGYLSHEYTYYSCTDNRSNDCFTCHWVCVCVCVCVCVRVCVCVCVCV